MSGLETESSLTSVNEQLKEIIAKVEEFKLENKKGDRVRFGKVKAVIEESGVATVTPEEADNLLQCGTPVFIQSSVHALEDERDNYLLVGHVEDIFGPVKSPMYAVKLLTVECGTLARGDVVYYINADVHFFTLNDI